MMTDFSDIEERIREIETFLELVTAFESRLRNGDLLFSDDFRLKPIHQNMLISSIYLQLYNLVEATVSTCLYNLICDVERQRTTPGALNGKLRREWSRYMAKTHQDLNAENRLDAALKLCSELLESNPINGWKIEVGSGNWDDDKIEKLCERIGLTLEIQAIVRQGVKSIYREDRNALKFLKYIRNKLAHGEISFSQSSEGVAVDEMKDFAEKVVAYLREIIMNYSTFISSKTYLHMEDSGYAGN